MGCRPIWDHGDRPRHRRRGAADGASIGRARVDVTWRISGLFRDLFPAQIALIDAAVQAVAARDETDDENPLAAARRAAATATTLARIFGTAPGAYGAGVEDLIGRDADRAQHRRRLSRCRLARLWRRDRASGAASPGAFAQRVADRRSAGASGRRSGPRSARRRRGCGLRRRLCGGRSRARPRARSDHARRDRSAAPARATACQRRWPASCGRARSIRASSPARCATARAAPPSSPRRSTGWSPSRRPRTPCRARCSISCTKPIWPTRSVRAFLLRENPAAARAIAARLDSARRRGLWHPRRNDIDADLAALRAEAGHERRHCTAAAPARASPLRCRPATACWRGSRPGRDHRARRLRRRCARRRAARQRHHRDHGARQHPGARA